jgi:hypothetical protein
MGPTLLSSFKDLVGIMGKAVSIGIIVAVAIAGVGRPATAAPVDAVQAELDKGDAQHAADLASAALTGHDVNAATRARLLLYRGLARELLGAENPAMRDLTAALNTRALSTEEQMQALLQRGFVCDGLGRLDEAAADYTAVIAQQGGGLATALNNRANIYRRQNRQEEAQRDYQAALAASGDKAQYAWYGLGQIAETRGDTAAARSFYTNAVAADPGYALASQRLAILGPPAPGDAETANRAVPGPQPAAVAAVTPAPSDTAAPIVLGPPRGDAADDNAPIVLRPPRRIVLHSPIHPVRPTPSPAVVIGPEGLRPALDQSGRPAGHGGAEVQLGAWRSEAEAQTGWERAKVKAGAVLDGVAPHIEIADLPGRGRYYRLRVIPKANASRTAFCAELTDNGVDCLPARD